MFFLKVCLLVKLMFVFETVIINPPRGTSAHLLYHSLLLLTFLDLAHWDRCCVYLPGGSQVPSMERPENLGYCPTECSDSLRNHLKICCRSCGSKFKGFIFTGCFKYHHRAPKRGQGGSLSFKICVCPFSIFSLLHSSPHPRLTLPPPLEMHLFGSNYWLKGPRAFYW